MTENEKFNFWRKKVNIDLDLVNELEYIRNKPEIIKDAFCYDLSFGTGGLRGIIGVGTNRMNIYTVSRATQGLANYLINKYKENIIVAISYDNRIKSDLFSKVTASVLCANNIKVYICSEPMPTPFLSFVVRDLKCHAGIMITASHNPKEYNGYKVYNDEGCQITDISAKEITKQIDRVDYFSDVKFINAKEDFGFYEEIKYNNIEYINDSIIDKYISIVKNQSVLFGEKTNKDIKIAYSPLNGTGLKFVTKLLKELNYSQVYILPEQKDLDGNFPTCPFPNPENITTMELGIKYAEKCGADIFLATDPDCDRVGVAVNDGTGAFRLLTGNQVGVLLFNFICEQRKKHNEMPNNPQIVKTIVTTDLVEKIAIKYDIKTANLLTGFKYIGEYIGKLKKENDESQYIFGFEESCGYLSGTYVRDKDAINAILLIVEMIDYYKTNNISIFDKYNEICSNYGYYIEKQYSFAFEGLEGKNKIKNIIDNFRNNIKNVANYTIINKIDYLQSINGLPKANVLKLRFDNGSNITLRPSGTEPKLKIYISAVSSNYDEAERIEKELINSINKLIK